MLKHYILGFSSIWTLKTVIQDENVTSFLSCNPLGGSEIYLGTQRF